MRRIMIACCACLLSVVLIPACGSTADAPVTPDTGTLVVVNKGDDTATLIDIQSAKTLATLPTGGGPHEAATSRDGRWAVITDYSGGNSLTIIDIPALKIAGTSDLSRFSRPHGIAFLPGDSLVAVTSEATRSVVLVRVPSGDIAGSVSTEQGGSHMLALVGDGSRVYTSNMQDDTVSEIDLEKSEMLRTFEVDATPEAIAVSPDGGEVWVGGNANGTLSVIQLPAGEIKHIASGFQFPYRIFFTSDGQSVVVPDLAANTLRVFDRASRKETGSLDLPGGGPESLTMGDSKKVIYMSLTRQARVVAIELESLEILGYYSTGNRPDGIAWSPVVVE